MDSNLEPIKRAIKAAGTGVALAKLLGVTPQAVSQWAKGAEIAPERIIEIARATDWKVTPHELNARLYPNPKDGLPLELQA